MTDQYTVCEILSDVQVMKLKMIGNWCAEWVWSGIKKGTIFPVAGTLPCNDCQHKKETK